jgi:Rad3-related DNA helicase
MPVQNADTFAFQDTIGKGLLDILQCVPDGVLCFTASYGMIDKLSQRWKVGSRGRSQPAM